MHDDPHLWLEDIDDPAALDWVRAQNAVTEAELAGTAEFARLEDELCSEAPGRSAAMAASHASCDALA